MWVAIAANIAHTSSVSCLILMMLEFLYEMCLIYLFESHSEAFEDSMKGESEDGEEVPDRAAGALAGQQVRVGQAPLFLDRGSIWKD